MLQTRTSPPPWEDSPAAASGGRDLRLLRAEEEDKAEQGQDSAGLGGMLLERGIAGDEHGARIAPEKSPQWRSPGSGTAPITGGGWQTRPFSASSVRIDSTSASPRP